MVSEKIQGIGLFSSYLNAENALRKLKDLGFPMQQLSFVVQMEELENELIEIYHNYDPSNSELEAAKARVVTGGLFKSLVGLLGRVKTLKISLLDKRCSIVAGGALANIIRNHAEERGFSLVNTLLSLEIPQERAQYYCDRVRQGNCLIVVSGTTKEMAQATKVLNRSIQAWEMWEDRHACHGNWVEAASLSK